MGITAERWFLGRILAIIIAIILAVLFGKELKIPDWIMLIIVVIILIVTIIWWYRYVINK